MHDRRELFEDPNRLTGMFPAQAGGAVADGRRGAVPSPAHLLDAPEQALDLAPGDAAALLATVEGLAAVLRIAATPRPARNGGQAGDKAPSPTDSRRDSPSERWLTPLEVARDLRRTRAWVYRRAKSWAFVTRPSRKTLLISAQGLNRWLERH